MIELDTARVERARAAVSSFEAMAARTEADRRLPAEGVALLIELGVFRMQAPRAVGGLQCSAATQLAVIEQVARGDGSAGWCAMIGATSSLMGAFLDEATAREVYGPPDAVTSGVFAPMGLATPVEGGYRVSGRWSFASGCEHAAWRMGGALVPGPSPDAPPALRSMLFTADQTRIVDTWDTSGLRGTGSHDLVVEDAFVPASRAFSMIDERPRYPGYTVPFFGLLAGSVAAVSLGIARAALDAFTQLVRTKQPPGSRRTLAHRELVQLEVARSEARLRAARALLFSTFAEVDQSASARGEATPHDRALLRLAASHAAHEATAVVDAAYHGAGASAVYTRNPLQRHFRDAHVAVQHLMVSPTSDTLAGRVLLGLDADIALL